MGFEGLGFLGRLGGVQHGQGEAVRQIQVPQGRGCGAARFFETCLGSCHARPEAEVVQQLGGPSCFVKGKQGFKGLVGELGRPCHVELRQGPRRGVRNGVGEGVDFSRQHQGFGVPAFSSEQGVQVVQFVDDHATLRRLGLTNELVQRQLGQGFAKHGSRLQGNPGRFRTSGLRRHLPCALPMAFGKVQLGEGEVDFVQRRTMRSPLKFLLEQVDGIGCPTAREQVVCDVQDQGGSHGCRTSAALVGGGHEVRARFRGISCIPLDVAQSSLNPREIAAGQRFCRQPSIQGQRLNHFAGLSEAVGAFQIDWSAPSV